jgi:hypothetical protein
VVAIAPPCSVRFAERFAFLSCNHDEDCDMTAATRIQPAVRHCATTVRLERDDHAFRWPDQIDAAWQAFQRFSTLRLTASSRVWREYVASPGAAHAIRTDDVPGAGWVPSVLNSFGAEYSLLTATASDDGSRIELFVWMATADEWVVGEVVMVARDGRWLVEDEFYRRVLPTRSRSTHA